MSRTMTGFLVVAMSILAPAAESALIVGGVGNKALVDPGWPRGADVIFSHVGRAAWWEGPPFGGGQWHAECRGDATVLNSILADFARLDVKTKRVVVHDGIGHSFWLAPNREPDKLEAARIDWVFMVWEPANWVHLRKLPVEVNPTVSSDIEPPSQIDVFTANIRWGDVTVPDGIVVLDQRLESHGFTAADGGVIEGLVTDLPFNPAGFSAGSRWLSEATKEQALSECRLPWNSPAIANGRAHGMCLLPRITAKPLSPVPG